MGITRAALHPAAGRYLAKEALRYLAGTLLSLPAMRLPMVNATGGWTASVVDMVRFLTNLDGSRGKSVLAEKTRKLMIEPPPEPLKPRPDGTWFGLGWDSVAVKGRTFGFYKEGSYQGMRTFMKRLPTGVCWAPLTTPAWSSTRGHAAPRLHRPRSTATRRARWQVSGHRPVQGIPVAPQGDTDSAAATSQVAARKDREERWEDLMTFTECSGPGIGRSSERRVRARASHSRTAPPYCAWRGPGTAGADRGGRGGDVLRRLAKGAAATWRVKTQATLARLDALVRPRR